MKRLLCIWLPGWPIQRLLSRELTPAMTPGAAELDTVAALQDSAHELPLTESTLHESKRRRTLGRPLVLWDTDPRRGRLVVACCRRAAAAGARVGMPIAGASELTLDHAPVVLQHDPWLDQQAIEKVAADLQRKITPLVAIETLDDQPWAGQNLHQPQALWCDVTGIAHLFGGERKLLTATQTCLKHFGCIGRMAIADNAAAAWALAHYATRPRHRSGNDSTESFIASPETTTDHLHPLSVKALRIPTTTADTLQRLGVERISQLLALPRSGLASRLGETLVNRLSQALGEIETPLQIHRAESEDAASLELEYPSGDEKILADRIERLIKKVRAGLETRQRGALRVTCRLALADLPPLTFEVGLFAPTLDVDHLTCLLVSAVEAKPLPAPVTHITVEITLSGPLQSSQTTLFDTEPATSVDRHSVGIGKDWMRNPASARLIDSLSGRLGRDAVVGVAVNENPLPEKAITTFPLTGNPMLHQPKKRHRPKRSRSTTRSTHNHSMHDNGFLFRRNSSFIPRRENPIRRPLHLLPAPSAITAPPVPPNHPSYETTDLPPAFLYRGRAHRVIRYWGPERIETDWWQGDSIRRDYYRVETDRGQWWWIFRCLGQRPNQWMLHGYF